MKHRSQEKLLSDHSQLIMGSHAKVVAKVERYGFDLRELRDTSDAFY